MRALSIFTIFSTLTLTGCLSWPQTPNEFIDTVGEGTESIVNQPYKDVVVRNNELVKECWSVKVVHRSSGNAMKWYNPKIHEGESSTMYTLQSDGGVNTGWPEGGMYMFSGQVIKISDNKTRIITHGYWSDLNSDDLHEAFHAWSTGKSNVCPNIS